MSSELVRNWVIFLSIYFEQFQARLRWLFGADCTKEAPQSSLKLLEFDELWLPIFPVPLLNRVKCISILAQSKFVAYLIYIKIVRSSKPWICGPTISSNALLFHCCFLSLLHPCQILMYVEICFSYIVNFFIHQTFIQRIHNSMFWNSPEWHYCMGKMSHQFNVHYSSLRSHSLFIHIKIGGFSAINTCAMLDSIAFT